MMNMAWYASAKH